ncbi:MAG: hypothetical protein U0N69_03025 [Senegalimassilia anaerobia]
MDIESAKQQVKDTITAYLSRHDNGAYRIPFEMQRPIFLPRLTSQSTFDVT